MSFALARRGLSRLVNRERYCRRFWTFNNVANRSFLSVRLLRNEVAKYGNFPAISVIAYRGFSSAVVDPSTPTANQAEEADGKTSPTDYPVVLEPSEEVMAGLSPEDQKKLKILVMEREVFRQSGYPVPRKMTDGLWLELLTKDSRMKRLKFYRFLLINENHDLKRKAKKAELRELRLSEPRKEVAEGELEYGLNRNTIFLRLRDATINAHFNHWQCQGVRFGQNIVVDLGYEQFMSEIENKNCADQIRLMYAVNKINRDPFHFHLCNARPGNRTYETVQSYLPNLNTSTNLISTHSECYLDIFPRDKLVYLTPHCKETLTHYDHDAVYIIGALVDKTVQQPLSLAKSKKQGIAMARLPLDIYLDWGSGGGKSLTLDQMMKIMLDIKNTGDWNTALAHVPIRKLRRNDDENFQRNSKPPHIRRRNSIFYDGER